MYFHVIDELNCIFIYPVLRGIDLIRFIANDSIQNDCIQLFLVITLAWYQSLKIDKLKRSIFCLIPSLQ